MNTRKLLTLVIGLALASPLVAMERQKESSRILRPVYFLFDNILILSQFENGSMRQQLRELGIEAQFLPVESSMPERMTQAVHNLVKGGKTVVSVRWADAYDMGDTVVADPMNKLVKRCPLKLVLAQNPELMNTVLNFQLDYSTLVFRDEQRSIVALTDCETLARLLSTHCAATNIG